MPDIYPFLSQRPHKHAAVIVALLLLTSALVISPFISIPLPDIAPFLPVYGTAVVLLESITAYLLLSQFASNRQVFAGFVASAYLFLIPLVTVQLLVFPGVFAPKGLLNAGAQSAVWIWVFWHASFPTLILLALITQQKLTTQQVAPMQLKYWL